MTRRAFLAPCLLGVLAAGCAGPAEPGTGLEAGIAADVGRIVGVVIDDQLQPVPGATVVLDGQDTANTDQAGAFTFPAVSPGQRFLAASLDGYASTQTVVDAVAGESVTVSLMLLPNSLAQAYHETAVQTGFIACATGLRDPAHPNDTYVNLCGVLVIAGLGALDQIGLDWPAGAGGDDVVGFWGETRWTPGYAFSTALIVRWAVENYPLYKAGAADYPEHDAVDIAGVRGDSPLAVRIPKEWLSTPSVDTGNVLCLPEKACWLSSGHYPYAQTTSGAADATMHVQQRYEEFLTIFHGGALPDTFSAIADG